MGRMKRGWGLTKKSWGVLTDHRQLAGATSDEHAPVQACGGIGVGVLAGKSGGFVSGNVD